MARISPRTHVALALAAVLGLSSSAPASPGGVDDAWDEGERPAGCAEPVQDASRFSPVVRCQLRLFRQRCNEVDRCLVACLLTGEGEGVGGGCFRVCQSRLGGVPWDPPAGLQECTPPATAAEPPGASSSPPPPSGSTPSSAPAPSPEEAFLEPTALGRSMRAWREDLASPDRGRRRKAIRALASSQQLDRDPTAEPLLPLLSEALHDGDREIGLAGVEALRRMAFGCGAAFSVLLQALEAHDPAVRIAAVQAVVSLLAPDLANRVGGKPRPEPPPQTVAALLHLISDPSPEVRVETIRGLQRIVHREPEAICAGLAGLLHDPSEEIRAAAVTALNSCGSLRAGVREVLDDESAEVRHVASLVLWQHGRGQPGFTIARLAQVLDSREPERRQQAVEALRANRDLMAGDLRHTETAAADRAVGLAAYVRALDDDDERVRWGAAHGIEELGEIAAPAIPAITTLLARTRDRSKQEAAASALAGLGRDPDALASTALARALFSQESGGTRSARALAHLGAGAAAAVVSELSAALRSGRPVTGFHTAAEELSSVLVAQIASVVAQAFEESQQSEGRRQLAGYLAEIGPGASVATPPLAHALREDPAEPVRVACAGALGRMPSFAAIEALEGAQADRSAIVRESAEAALGTLEWPAASAPRAVELAALLGSESVPIRRIAARELCSQGPDALSEVAAMASAMDDPDGLVVWGLQRCLEGFGPDALTAIPELVAAMTRQRVPVLAGSIQATVVTIAKDSQVVPQALADAVSHPDAVVRWRATSALREIGSPDAATAAAPALADPDLPVRFQAALAQAGGLGTGDAPAGGAGAVPVLLGAVLDLEPERYAGPDEGSSAPAVVDAALGVLCTFSPEVPGALDALVRLIEHTDPRIRARAMWCLSGAAPAPLSAAPALRAGLADPDPQVRLASAAALAAADPPAGAVAVPVLIRALQQGDPAIRRTAVDVLGRIGPADAPAAAAIRGALDDPDPLVREVAGHAAIVALPPTRETVDLVLKQLLTGGGRRARIFHQHTLWDIGPEAAAAVPGLLEAVRRGSGTALELLGRIGPQQAAAVPVLVEALQDPSPEVRWGAIAALAAMGPAASGAVEALAAAALDHWSTPSRDAARALWALGPAAASVVPRLLDLLREPLPAASRAAEILVAIGPDQAGAVPALLLALHDDELRVREAAAAALGGIGPGASAAMPALRRAARGEIPGVHRSVFKALVAIGGIAPDEMARLEGTVVGRDGRPLADCPVTIHGEVLPRNVTARCDASGRFALELPAADGYWLEVALTPEARTATQPFRLWAGATTIRLLRVEPRLPMRGSSRPVPTRPEPSPAQGVSCDVRSRRGRYDVGDLPDLEVTLRNGSQQELVLLRGLDCAGTPRMSLGVTGPAGSTPASTMLRCPPASSLGREDVVVVPPAGVFHPYREAPPLLSAPFSTTGRYLFEFEYGSFPSQSQVLRWSHDPAFADRLGRVAWTGTTCRVEVEVGAVPAPRDHDR